MEQLLTPNRLIKIKQTKQASIKKIKLQNRVSQLKSKSK